MYQLTEYQDRNCFSFLFTGSEINKSRFTGPEQSSMNQTDLTNYTMKRLVYVQESRLDCMFLINEPTES